MRTNHAENPLSIPCSCRRARPGLGHEDEAWAPVGVGCTTMVSGEERAGPLVSTYHEGVQETQKVGKTWIRRRFRLQKTTVTILMLSLPRKGLLPHMGNRFPIFGTGCMYSSVMPAAPCIPSPPTNHGRKQP